MSIVGVLNRAAIRVQLPVVLVAVPIVATLHGWWIAPIVVDGVLVTTSEATIEASIQAARLVVLAVGCVVVMACAASAMLLRGSLRHAVEQLHGATEAIARGEFGHRVRSRRRDELGRLAAAIDALAERLERLEQARLRTLACVSHELRTPLTIIQGQAFTLARTEPDSHRLERLELVQSEAMQLARLVDDLVQASSLHAGSARLSICRRDLVMLVGDQVARFAEAAAARGLEFELRGSRHKVMADIDPDRFGQVLTNLLANAVRHAPRDSRVSVSIDVVRGARMQREIIVTNECEPIAPTIAHRLFEPFVQGAAHSGSVGLGLTIVHALVAAHGGTIAIDVDAAARGTARFSIELPAPARARVESTTSAGRVHAAARLAAVES